MPKVICAASDCIYNDEDNTCTANTIHLTDSYYHTVHEGVKHFNICKDYRRDPRADDLFKEFVEFMNRSAQE